MNATLGLVQGILAAGHVVVSVAVVAEVGHALSAEMPELAILAPAVGQEHLVVVTTSDGTQIPATLTL